MPNRTKGWLTRARRVALAAALAALAIPGTAAAQSAEDAGSPNGFELAGYVGGYLPLSNLANSGDTLSAEFTTKVDFGLGLEYWFGSFGVALNGNYSNPNLTIQVFDPDSPGFSIPLDLGATDLWMAAANVLWRPQLQGSESVLQPYFGAGPGVVKVTYPSSDDFTIQDETRIALSLVGGAHVAVRKGWFVRLDLRDYISRFDTEPFTETKTQHDFIVSFGVGYAFH